MTLVAVLYAEYRRLEEELHRPGAEKQWDEKTFQYFSMLQKMFHYRKSS